MKNREADFLASKGVKLREQSLGAPGFPVLQNAGSGNPRPVLPRKDWPPDLVFLLLTRILMAFAAAIAVLSLVSASAGKSGASVPALVNVVVGGLAFHGTGWVLIHFFVRRTTKSWNCAFGFGIERTKAVLSGLALALVFLPLAYGLQMLCASALRQFGVDASAQKSVELLLTDGTLLTRGTIALLAVGLAPVVEEALFRGILFPLLRDLGWRVGAFAGTALLFGAIHGNAAAFLPLTLFGAALAWLYERTGNLLAPMVAHAVFNLAPFVLLSLGIRFGN